MFEKFENKCVFVFLVCFGLYIYVLSVSMRFNVIFCIYEHISKYIVGCLRAFLSKGYRLFRRPQISFVCVIVFVSLGLCDCEIVGF